MRLNRTPDPLDRSARNDENENWSIIESLISKLEREIDSLVLENSGDSNAEVVAARGGFRTLGRRLNDIMSQLEEKANENEARMKRDKIKPEDASEDFLALMTGEGTINLETIPQDGSVTPQKTSDIAGLNMYPFQRKATLSDDPETALQISRAIVDVKLYNANELLNYRINTIRKGFYQESLGLYEWSIFIYDSAGNTASLYRVRKDTLDGNEFAGVQKVTLGSAIGSKVTADVIVNWDALPDGFENAYATFNRTGLDRKTISELGMFMTEENEEWVI